MTMDETTKTILSARRRSFLRSRPVFKRYAPVSEAELFRLATGLHFKFTVGLAKWLLLAGYGDIDETLSFRKDWFSVIHGHGKALDGYVAFAQDAVGNRYAFNPKNGGIYYLRHSEPGVAKISDSFLAFMQELIRRDYQLQAWMDSLPVL